MGNTLQKSPIARQFRQHYREPYDLRRLQRVGNRSRMHFPRAGRYLRAAIGAIDFISIYSDFPIKRRRMITTMGLVTHAMKSQKRVLRSSHRAIAITRIHSSTFMVVVIFRYFVGLVDLMGQRYGIYLTLPNVWANFFLRRKIDFIRMNCPMAVLTEGLKTSDESELPSAAFFPSVTLRVTS